MNHEHDRRHGEADSEALALLTYMADHNAHHAGELQELEARLPEKAAACVREAVSLLNAFTEKLRQAIGRLEE